MISLQLIQHGKVSTVKSYCMQKSILQYICFLINFKLKLVCISFRMTICIVQICIAVYLDSLTLISVPCFVIIPPSSTINTTPSLTHIHTHQRAREGCSLSFTGFYTKLVLRKETTGLSSGSLRMQWPWVSVTRGTSLAFQRCVFANTHDRIIHTETHEYKKIFYEVL